jgi:beta-glucosidase/6-phospho-beta-glucosidase/beta-galactosidase
VEGGFDGPFQPATCYSPTVALGRHDGPGDALDLWHHYEDVLDLVPELGLDGVRLTLEWARLEPRPGEVSKESYERYRDVISYAHTKELHVSVVLVDAAWPSWLGLEAWLLPWVVPYVRTHAQRTLDMLGDSVDGVIGFARAASFTNDGYLLGTVPPWRKDARDDAASAEKQLTSLAEQLRADANIGEKWISNFHEVPANVSVKAMRELVGGAAGMQEVHLRSLTDGFGPTKGPSGLLAKETDAWRVRVSAELLAFFSEFVLG